MNNCIKIIYQSQIQTSQNWIVDISMTDPNSQWQQMWNVLLVKTLLVTTEILQGLVSKKITNDHLIGTII